MIRYIRSCFCNHDFVKVGTLTSYRYGITTTYLCKKCGWIRKVKTNYTN